MTRKLCPPTTLLSGFNSHKTFYLNAFMSPLLIYCINFPHILFSINTGMLCLCLCLFIWKWWHEVIEMLRYFCYFLAKKKRLLQENMNETSCKQTVHSVCCKIPLPEEKYLEYFGKLAEDFSIGFHQQSFSWQCPFWGGSQGFSIKRETFRQILQSYRFGLS